MPAKNDLSAFKSRPQAAPILQSLPPEPKLGRKTRVSGEKESETLALKLTKSEMQALERNA